MPVNYRKVHEGVASRETHFILLNDRPPSDVPHFGEARGKWYEGKWWEIRQEEYQYFLEILPPLHMQDGFFALCEFTTGNVTSAFFKIKDRYFCGYVDGTKIAHIMQMRHHIEAEITGRSKVYGDASASAR